MSSEVIVDLLFVLIVVVLGKSETYDTISEHQDMFDYAQGYFKCYQVVRFKDDDYVDYIFPMDQNIHLKMV